MKRLMTIYTKRAACFLSVSAACLSHAALAADNFSLGLEGFRDHYQEPDPGVQVDEHADYGSVTGGWTHSYGRNFTGLDGRASYGKDDYKSTSGVDNGIPQYEFEARLRQGLNVAMGGGTLSPYIGLGTRYFYDKSKDTVTNLGFYGYDRRILQFYAPIGATYTFTSGSWTFAPNAEFDPLLLGKVNSRLQNGGGYNITNTQSAGSGYGIRGEFMVGQKGWQVGPFVRYWHINQSDTTTAPDGSQWVEPRNERLQYGAALRFLF